MNLKVKVAPYRPRNPYQTEQIKYLNAVGVKCEPLDMRFRSDLLFKIMSCDILHLHWLRPLYENTRSERVMFLKSRLLIFLLKAIKLFGVKIVVTMHNVMPHQKSSEKIDEYVRKKVAKIADALLFHNQESLDEFQTIFKVYPDKCHIIPHAMFDITNAKMTESLTAKGNFNIPKDKICLLFLGRGGTQKGEDRIIKALDAFDQAGIQVILAGQDFANYKSVQYNNLTIIPEHIPENKMPELFSAIDAVALPYRACSTSGLAVMALGFKRPLICSDLPVFQRFAASGTAAICNTEDSSEFANKVIQTAKLGQSKAFQKACEKFKQNRSWTEVTNSTVKLYKDILK